MMHSCCPGPLRRREFLRAGTLALGGLSMPELLRLRAEADESLGVLRGQVLGFGLAGKTPIRESAVLAVHRETGETTRIESAEGIFETILAPGQYRLVAEAEAFEGKPRNVSVKAGGEVRVDLRMRRKR